jgi:hypothetical protein
MQQVLVAPIRLGIPLIRVPLKPNPISIGYKHMHKLEAIMISNDKKTCFSGSESYLRFWRPRFQVQADLVSMVSSRYVPNTCSTLKNCARVTEHPEFATQELKIYTCERAWFQENKNPGIHPIL